MNSPGSTPDSGRLPPHDDDAEAGILGSILAGGGRDRVDKCVETCVSTLNGVMGVDAFYDLRNRTAYSAILDLYYSSQAIDLITVQGKLRDHQMLDQVGLPYLQKLPDASPSPENLPTYLEMVKAKYVERRAVRASSHAVGLIYDGRPDEGIRHLRSEVETIDGIQAAANGKLVLTFRKPGDFLTMKFDDSDLILGDRLLTKGGKLVIAAAGGTGKSRLILQLIAAIIAERKFLALTTHAGSAPLTWLLLQTENSNRRLQDDCGRINNWLNGSFDAFHTQVDIHTVETDSDCFVALDNPDNVANIESAIQHFRPTGGVIWDPLNEFSIGDPNKDVDMKRTCSAISQITRRGNPQRAVIALHHSLTGKAGHAKATGYDRASFSRGSKALYAWTRSQINIAPVDPENNDRLIIACGKCNDGREFLTFGARLNPETMIYECDPSINIKEWESEMSGKKAPVITAEGVAAMCGLPTSKTDLVKALIEETGCHRCSAYNIIRAMERKGVIKKTGDGKSYVQK